jgi:hypothetical protein
MPDNNYDCAAHVFSCHAANDNVEKGGGGLMLVLDV